MSKINYWNDETQKLIIKYIDEKDEDIKIKIYEKDLIPVFSNLTKNIYMTYGFNKSFDDYKQIEHDVLVHLYNKTEKFDPDKGKSFSYFGTIIKRFLIQKASRKKKNVSLDNDKIQNDFFTQDVSIDNFHNEKKVEKTEDVIENLIQDLKDEAEYTEEYYNEEDKKVIEIIIYILSNYKKVDIYNKKQLYVYLREATNLKTRKITKAIKKLKELYEISKFDTNND